MKIDENNYNIIKRASELTCTDYNIYWKDAENIDGYIDNEELLNIIEDLICEVDRLEEEIEKKQQEYEDDPHDRWLDYKEGMI